MRIYKLRYLILEDVRSTKTWVDVKRNGDHFGVDLGIISGFGIISGGCTGLQFTIKNVSRTRILNVFRQAVLKIGCRNGKARQPYDLKLNSQGIGKLLCDDLSSRTGWYRFFLSCLLISCYSWMCFLSCAI